MFHVVRRALAILSLSIPVLVWYGFSAAGQLTLTWSDTSSNEDGFKIERRTGPSGAFVQLATHGADATVFTDSNLAAGTTYCYRVRAFNAAEDLGYSNEACATTAQDFALTVVRAGTGSGTVSSSPGGIACGTDCSEPYPGGTTVALAAAPAGGSVFDGWSGGCGGGTCSVTLAADTVVTATFVPAPSVTLTVAKAGRGEGTVTSAPAGISCGADCVEPYPAGNVLTVTAAPATGSAFAGWSGGGCSGRTSCTVTLGADTTVTATFKRYRRPR